MTVQEMHIELDLNIQKINSNSTKNIEPEEKDWFLNNEVIKFLNQRTRDLSDKRRLGFEEDTKRLKDIQPLIRKRTLDVEALNIKEGRFILPSFVFKPIRTDCIFFKDCNASKSKEVTKRGKVYEFKLDNVKRNQRLKIEVFIDGVSTTIFDTANLPSGVINGVYFDLLKIFRNKAMKLNESQSNFEIYFEQLGNLWNENSFFIAGLNNITKVLITVSPVNSLSIQGRSPSVDDRTKVTDVDFKATNIKMYKSEKQIKRQGRLVNEELEGFKVSSSISQSVQESPLLSLERGYGFVYNPLNTIIKNVDFVYICEPLSIDIHLNQGLNLYRDVCIEICLKASQFIKAVVDAGNYEKFANENILIE